MCGNMSVAEKLIRAGADLYAVNNVSRWVNEFTFRRADVMGCITINQIGRSAMGFVKGEADKEMLEVGTYYFRALVKTS
jgi:hypothetical protein